jgi:exodeoxyribonuclease VII large subunit
MAKKELTIYTVSQVTSLIKAALEEAMPAKMVVAGEISDWKIHYSSGHCYFSLKDESAVLPCVMWASDFKDVKFRPENGLAVLAKGFIDVYPPQGKYQFYVERLEPAGVGALQLAFEQMRKRLQAEGLFDEKHKRPLPKYPMRIGILTSESGAALYDIKDSIHNRWPCARLFLYPVPVQGEGAAEEIAAALRYVNRHNNKLKLNVLIVGRGGGSLEDLWAFNEEVLARAIFASKIPIISAVGHEVDITIADLVADARASTPTKACVIAVPDIKEVLKQIAN